MREKEREREFLESKLLNSYVNFVLRLREKKTVKREPKLQKIPRHKIGEKKRLDGVIHYLSKRRSITNFTDAN